MSKAINADFYDIESFENVFTLANYKNSEHPETRHIDLYYLCDNPDVLLAEPDWQAKIVRRIYERNRNLNHCPVFFHDLKERSSAEHLSRTFGVYNPNRPDSYPAEFRLTNDTDPEYDPEIHPYFMGYNSYNYDTTMLAYYCHCIWSARRRQQPGEKTNTVTYVFERNVTAKTMREFNDTLFSSKYKGNMASALAWESYGRGMNYSNNAWQIRKAMMMSGRYVDVARLNEKQSKVALKRLLGILGYQILESEKVGQGTKTIDTPDQFYDAVAYNISDVVNLRHLFYHPLYIAQFELKRGLMHTYPQIIYNQAPDSYQAVIGPDSVRNDRLTIDSSSAQFASKILCPYGSIQDIPVVSFMYPSKEEAEAKGIPRMNVLDEAQKFFYELFPQQELRDRFDEIVRYYKTIEGKNFNDSKAYMEAYGQGYDDDEGVHHEYQPPMKLAQIPPANTCIPYFDKDGNETTCFVVFSTGGIHGAECNLAKFRADLAAWQQEYDDIEEAKRQYPDPVVLRKERATITMPDGRERSYKELLKGGLKIALSQYKDISDKKPQLFIVQKTKGKHGNESEKYTLNGKYTITSAVWANHEDFKSYYPNLLRMMRAFYNEGLGYDRYAEVFYQKEDYGKKMKDKTKPDAERANYRNMREGTKLVLNSASGAADALFENNIRANNQIVSMRIIGQLFSWRIGQAQTYEGAYIPSTNTDGLYSVMDEQTNNAILARESAEIGVDIEPERLYLISKDSNNRLEMNPDGVITSASGESLGCRTGPTPAKALSHPAIIDWALAEYLVVASQNYKGLSLDLPFDETIGLSILRHAASHFGKNELLRMFQNILASSPASISYIYGMKDGSDEPIILQHYNRVFIIRDDSPLKADTMHLLKAAGRVVNKKNMESRIKNNQRPWTCDMTALKVLQANEVLADNGQPLSLTNMFSARDVISQKINGIDPEWNILILNNDLTLMSPEECDRILDSLDLDKYLSALKNKYEGTWMNNGTTVVSDDDDEDEED